MSTVTVSNTTVTGTGIANNASWAPLSLDPLSFVEPMIMWQQYFEWRGFKDWADMIAYFNGVSKLSGESISALMIRDFTEWRVEASK